jgi:hypothetical protein
MPGYNSQRRGTARTRPKLIVLVCVWFVCKCVLYCCHRVFVCKCVLYCCHWLSTQLQLTNVSNFLKFRYICARPNGVICLKTAVFMFRAITKMTHCLFCFVFATCFDVNEWSAFWQDSVFKVFSE